MGYPEVQFIQELFLFIYMFSDNEMVHWPVRFLFPISLRFLMSVNPSQIFFWCSNCPVCCSGSLFKLASKFFWHTTKDKLIKFSFFGRRLFVVSVIERSVKTSSCNCGFVHFSLCRLLSHVFWALLLGVCTFRIVVYSWWVDFLFIMKRCIFLMNWLPFYYETLLFFSGSTPYFGVYLFWY